MKRTLLISCLLTLMLTAMMTAAQQKQGAQLSTSQPTGKVAEIEAYATEIDAFVKDNEKDVRIFGDTSSGTKLEEAKWHQYKDEKERQAAETGDNLNSTAYVWMRDGKVVGANFMFQSPSRDWMQYVMYYFRDDGTLAKVSSTLNTFQGGITVVRDDYYNSKGKFLKGTTHCQDLKTQLSKPCGDFQDQPAPLFQKVSQLPFYGWLKK
ncbi:MAG: hypothetical protein JOZ52_12835 [Acidobacteria bacterium]|nr:hypothetical protein [Acidobacteriota bacterium]